jgi:hypothetical protein
MLKKIKSNFLVVSQYHFDIPWVSEYTDNYIIVERALHTLWTGDFEVKND